MDSVKIKSLSRPLKNDSMYLIRVGGKYLSFVRDEGVVLLTHKRCSIGAQNIDDAKFIANSSGYTENLEFEVSLPLEGCLKVATEIDRPPAS